LLVVDRGRSRSEWRGGHASILARSVSEGDTDRTDATDLRGYRQRRSRLIGNAIRIHH
jgi:hypothetical protein